jgi:hypothetical protein
MPLLHSDEFFGKDLSVYSPPAPPDYRALCAELLSLLDNLAMRNPEMDGGLLRRRARTALAQPEPVVDDDFVTAVNDLAKRTHKSKAEVLRDAINLYYKAVNEWEKNGGGIVFQEIAQPAPSLPAESTPPRKP